MKNRTEALFILTTICLSLLALEAIARVFLWKKDHTLWVHNLRDTFEYTDGMRYKNAPNINLYYWDTYSGIPVKALWTDKTGFVITGKGLSHLVQPDDHPYRIVLFGGSTLAGYGASENAKTVASQLERRLQARFPRKQIEVINAGVGGYCIQQEFVYYLLYLTRYRPDVVITMDGANNDANGPNFPQDTHAVRNDWHDWLDQWQASLSAPLIQYLFERRRNTFQLVIDWLVTPNNFWRTPEAIFRMANTLVNKDSRLKSAANFFHPADAMRPTTPVMNHAQYMEKVKSSAYCSTIQRFALFTQYNGSKYLAVFQPHPGYAKPLSSVEAGLPPDYLREVGKWLAALDESAPWVQESLSKRNARLLNLTRLFKGVSDTRYVDTCHYNDTAQDEIAEQLYRAILPWAASPAR